MQQSDFLRLLAAIAPGTAGAAMFNLAPLYLAAAIERFSLSDQQIGYLMSAEVAGIACASFAGYFLLQRFSWRSLALIGLSVVVIGNLVALFVHGYAVLLIIRFIVGLTGDGMAYVAAITALGLRQDPTRGFALLSFVNMCVTSATLTLLPLLTGGADWTSVSLLLVGLALIGLLLVVSVETGSSFGTSNVAATRINVGGVLLLLALFAYAMDLGAVWSYVERIGQSMGILFDELGPLLALSVIFQGLGSLCAAFFSTRADRRVMLVAALILQLAALFLLNDARTSTIYFIAVSMWGFSWNIGIANLLGAIAAARNGQRTLALAPGIEACGAAAGPAIVASLISPGVYTPIMVFAAIAVACSIMLTLAVTTLQPRASVRPHS